MSKTLIIGCGYIGLPLALKLMEQGHEVTGWVHSAESAEALANHPFHRVIVGNVGDEETWSEIEETYDLAIQCASSGRRGLKSYEDVFLKGTQMLHAHQGRARRLFVSSTSVYGQMQGEEVTEESPAEPISETSQVLREAEKVVLSSGGVVLRPSGIYGPGRGVLFEKLRLDEGVIEGDGLRWMNQIHQQDLVEALVHLIKVGGRGQIYNVTDDGPVTYLDFYTWCSEFLKKPLPPFGPVNTERKRGLTNKRVSNAKLRETGWQPRYPSFRQGIEADFRG